MTDNEARMLSHTAYFADGGNMKAWSVERRVEEPLIGLVECCESMAAAIMLRDHRARTTECEIFYDDDFMVVSKNLTLADVYPEGPAPRNRVTEMLRKEVERT